MSYTLESFHARLQQQLPGAQLVLQALPRCPGMRLYLLDPEFDDSDLGVEVRESISDDPPYWIFAWASGYALAEKLLAGEMDVAGKTVVDFGAGSAIVAIAAALAGAGRVISCEVDPVANGIMRLNAEANGVSIAQVSSLKALTESVDLVLAADVLYEKANMRFLDEFLAVCPNCLVADSRLKQLLHPRFRHVATHLTTSFPDFAEALEFNEVKFYQAEE